MGFFNVNSLSWNSFCDYSTNVSAIPLGSFVYLLEFDEKFLPRYLKEFLIPGASLRVPSRTNPDVPI